MSGIKLSDFYRISKPVIRFAFLFQKNMSNLVKPGYRSDHSLHSAVILEVKFNFVQRGKSQWKLKKKTHLFTQ